MGRAELQCRAQPEAYRPSTPSIYVEINALYEAQTGQSLQDYAQEREAFWTKANKSRFDQISESFNHQNSEAALAQEKGDIAF